MPVKRSVSGAILWGFVFFILTPFSILMAGEGKHFYDTRIYLFSIILGVVLGYILGVPDFEEDN